MTNTGINSNARMPRKSLSSQIDRLDGILDGLDTALSGAVADAVQAVVGQVVKEAVEASIKEVLGSPELLRAALAQHAPPAPQPQPRKSLREVLKAVVAVGMVRIAWRLRRVCFVALGVGALSAVGVYYAGPVVASVLCGLASSAMTAVGMALAPLWRLLGGNTGSA
jgi:hypothetical protein